MTSVCHSERSEESRLFFIPQKPRFFATLRMTCFVLFLFSNAFSSIPKLKTKSYTPPRPPIAGLHIAMSADSAEVILKKIARRQTPMKMDSLSLVESDSVRILGEPAYLQIQLLHNK